MLRDGKIQLGEFNLSVAADKPPAAYSQLSSDVALPNLKWIDGHKPVFRVNVSMVSSIHPKVRGHYSPQWIIMLNIVHTEHVPTSKINGILTILCIHTYESLTMLCTHTTGHSPS